ncbi:MAG: ABC transporter permease subunit [Clostridiales bacterium]|nr:ABC transporter permease subunit [Clostridiales bacterium]
MNTKIIKALIKKEVLDVFRDKKTVLMMLVVPVILYPLIFLGAMQIAAMISSGMEEQTYRIAVEVNGDDGAFLQKLMGKSKDNTDNAESANGVDNVDNIEEGYLLEISDINYFDSAISYEQYLNDEVFDAYIIGRLENGKMQYDVYYLSSVTNSNYAMNIVMDTFDEYREELTKEKIIEAGLDVHEILEPVAYENKDIASNEQSLGSIMGSILPFMLVISLLMGTMYPAIDTTAGERERGTLETILTLPVTNRQLIISKFLTVAVIGIISALLNILSMGGIAAYMYKILEMQTDTQAFDLAMFVPAILVCILAIFAFSLFISAITMCVTAFAKSYKEANNYITPLMLVVMFIGYIGFIPNIELNQTMAMVPVANICLLIKNLLVFKVDYTAIGIVLFSNVAYAVLAILFLSKIYDSESVLFGDAKGGMQLFERRSNLKKGGVPTTADAWFVVALTIMLVLYAGSLLQLKFGLAGVLGTQLILLGVPLFIVLYTKKDIGMTYGFHKTKAKNYLGALIMGIGLFFTNIVISAALVQLFPSSAEGVNATFSILLDNNILEVFFVIAVAPAICEEMLFRGMIFHALKGRYRIRTAIGIVAVLFGAYHMSLVKFIPTGLLGLVLCYVVYITGSIYPSMIMHFANNAMSVLISCYPEQLEKILPIFYKETISIFEAVILLIAGLALVGLGYIIMKGRKEIHDRYN